MRLKLSPEAIGIACVLAATRLVCRSRALYDIDSVNFALGIQRFDPSAYQPHPPGYFLYILAGRLLNLVCHDPNLALVLLSVLSGCGCILLLDRLARAWFGASEARFACLIFLFSPLAWFHGTVALTYAVEAFFSLLSAWLCWKVVRGTATAGWPAGIALGVAAGVRPSSLLLLGPLFVYSFARAPLRTRLSALGTLLLSICCWGIPMIVLAGGFRSYFNALISLWTLVPAQQTVFNSSPATSIARAATVFFILLLVCGTASLAVLARTRSAPPDPRVVRFTAVWIVPALLFFTFIYLKFVNSGYLLLLAGPCCLWLGRWVAAWYRDVHWPVTAKLAVIAGCAALNVWVYLDAPLYCSFRSVRRFEAQLASINAELPTLCSPSDTLVVAFDSHFLGYRHAGYYLPQFLTLQYPEVELAHGPRIFALNDRDTVLLSQLPRVRQDAPLGSRPTPVSREGRPYTHFVLFPLPSDSDAYSEYLHTVTAALPAGHLTTTTIGAHRYIVGNIQDLPLLFPRVARSDCVSSPAQSVSGCKQP